MAKIVSFSIQKGGVGKTITSGITSYLLSKKHKVLAVDFDSQGNLTSLLTDQSIYDFTGNTILEAVKTGQPKTYIHEITDQLHLLPAEDMLATFSQYIYKHNVNDPSYVLAKTLEPIKNDYDYIIIDTSPSLSDATINALTASDYVVVMCETSKFCYDALFKFLQTTSYIQKKANPSLKVAGVLRIVIDNRRMETKTFTRLLGEEFGDLVFSTLIYRKASTSRLPLNGFVSNPELPEALEYYVPFVKELEKRCQTNHTKKKSQKEHRKNRMFWMK